MSRRNTSPPLLPSSRDLARTAPKAVRQLQEAQDRPAHEPFKLMPFFLISSQELGPVVFPGTWGSRHGNRQQLHATTRIERQFSDEQNPVSKRIKEWITNGEKMAEN